MIPKRGVLQRKPTACSACVFLFSACLRKRAFDAVVKQKNRNFRFGFFRGERGIISIDPRWGSPAKKNQPPVGAYVFLFFVRLQKRAFDAAIKQKNRNSRFGFSSRRKRDYSMIPKRESSKEKPTACSACVFLFSVCLRKRGFDAAIKQKNRNFRFGFSSRRKRDYFH